MTTHKNSIIDLYTLFHQRQPQWLYKITRTIPHNSLSILIHDLEGKSFFMAVVAAKELAICLRRAKEKRCGGISRRTHTRRRIFPIDIRRVDSHPPFHREFFIFSCSIHRGWVVFDPFALSVPRAESIRLGEINPFRLWKFGIVYMRGKMGDEGGCRRNPRRIMF